MNQSHPHTPQPSFYDYEQILSQEGIRVTAVRLLVLKTIYNTISGAFSLQDVVSQLGTADPSSVFRALTLFSQKGLLHLIDDGSGVQKYCVCHCPDHHHHSGHIHFTCTLCHKTFCLTVKGDIVEGEFVVANPADTDAPQQGGDDPVTPPTTGDASLVIFVIAAVAVALVVLKKRAF